MPNIFISPHNKIGYLFLALTILAFAGMILGLFNIGYGVKIVITPKQEEVDANFNIQISEKVIEESGPAMPGRVLAVSEEAQEENTAQATVSIEDYAEGEVILTNNSQTPINFIAGTRFASPQGLIFRAIKAIKVAARGQIKIPVRADKTGPNYDLEPTIFSIPNLRDSQLKEKLSVISEAPMTGGLKKTGIIMQKDIDEAVKNLKEKLYAKGAAEIENELTGSDLKIIIESNVAQQECDAKAGDEKAEFTTSIKMDIKAVAFKEKDLLTLAVENLKKNISSGQELISYEPKSLSYRLIKHDLGQKQATLEVQFRGYAVISENHAALEKTRFQNALPKEIKTYLEGLKEVEQAQVKIWPPFILKKTPKDAAKIEIIIKKSQ